MVVGQGGMAAAGRRRAPDIVDQDVDPAQPRQRGAGDGRRSFYGADVGSKEQIRPFARGRR
jgi:hypothetical protein